jgi:two-component sensor histidine kinase
VAAGPLIVLAPKTSLSLSMALHELATNAAKYGALSVEEGAVHVTWNVEEDQDAPALKLVWRESGGPDVVPPHAFGFGTRLLKVTAAELGGTMDVDFAPTGLVWALRFPLKGA